MTPVVPPKTARQLIEQALDVAPDVLRIDVVLGENMLSEAEILLPKVLAAEPAVYPSLVSRLEKTWHDYVLGVLLFREDAEPTCH